MNYNTITSSYRIVQLISEDDPNNPSNTGGDTVFMLISNRSDGGTIGFAVSSTEPVPGRLVKFLAPATPTFSVSCNGCTTGCHIQPFGGNGSMAYFCSNPCEECSKSETLTNAPVPTNK